MFEPKPVQKPWPPMLIGGESKAALRRAAKHCDGWIGMSTTSSAPRCSYRAARPAEGRDDSTFQFCLGGRVASRDDVKRWEEIGVTRMVFAPWQRSREAIDGMRRFAEAFALTP